MTKYLAPLGIFIGGQLLLLILWLFLPQMGDAGAAVAANSHIDTFWGMEWASNGIRIIVVVLGELFVTGTALWAFLKARTS
jgi:hypothetical protein